MKQISVAVLLLAVLISGCKTLKPDTRHPEKNGIVTISLERTPCFGKCPVYSIKVHENGLVIYNAEKNTDTVGCFYTILTKQEVQALKNKFVSNGFMDMADRYPEEGKAPVDLPSCVLTFNNDGKIKTVRDKRWETPMPLAELQTTIEQIVKNKILHNCDN